MRRVDLNTATESELADLPGIGPAKAQAIIAHRSTTPFSSPEDLRQVKGIGDHLFESLKDRISVSGKTVTGSSHAASPASASNAETGGSHSQHRAEGTAARQSAR
jgi:competence protein ComEA